MAAPLLGCHLSGKQNNRIAPPARRGVMRFSGGSIIHHHRLRPALTKQWERRVGAPAERSELKPTMQTLNDITRQTPP